MRTNGRPLTKERDNPERIYSIALVILCAIVFFYGLGGLPLIGPDEPRYAEVAREMYATGDWVTPRLGGIKWFEKPALTYWISAAGYALFGENEFGARFGVAVVATLGVLLLYYFGRREHSARFGYLSAATLATCGLWPGFARGATFDLPLTVAIEIALFSFFLWESKESQVGANRLWYVFCFALGLATLAKGLVGVIVPLAIVAPYLFLTGAWKMVLKPRLLVTGALIFL
ncbi:MAG: ArnT family glycosyltransferase, partial [Blastocatellia bacterium]